MGYNINLSNYLNNVLGNNNISNTEGKDIVTNSMMKEGNALEQIKNMLIGDIFSGKITGLNGKEISLLLQDGSTLNASLKTENENVSFSKGDEVTFLVENKTDSSIILKSMDNDATNNIVLNKALEAANLAINKENLDLVKGLMKLNMPIDKNTLNNAARELTKFPEASTDTVLRLIKLDIPVTQNNIIQFEAYKAYEHDITSQINNFSSDLGNIVNEFVTSNNIPEAVEFLKEFIQIFSGEQIKSLHNKVMETNEQKNLNIVQQDVENKTQIPMEHINNLQLNEKENFNIKDIIYILSDDKIPMEDKLKLLESKEFKEIIKHVINDKMFINPENIADKKEVKEFYKNLLETLHKAEDVIMRHNLNETDLGKGLQSVKQNVQFMNDLNHNLAFLQIPIKLQEGEARGDLYVYTNKKSLAANKDNLTALLHLDMENLGPMDVYVKMTDGINVSTNFCLETEELLDFIYSHIDILTKRLNDKGYNFTPTMTVKDFERNKVDFVNDFLDVSNPVIPVTRYMFDTKA